MIKDNFISSLPVPKNPEQEKWMLNLQEEIYIEFERAKDDPSIQEIFNGLEPIEKFDTAVMFFGEMLKNSDAAYLPNLLTTKLTEYPCQKGCAYCCKSQFIKVESMEVIRIVRSIERSRYKPFLVNQILKSTATFDGVNLKNSKCAMLSNYDSCLIDSEKPIVCMSYASTSKEACRSFCDGSGIYPHQTLYRMFTTNAFCDTFLSDIRIDFGGAGNSLYEINSILKRIYEHPSKIESWVNGQPTYENDLLLNVK